MTDTQPPRFVRGPKDVTIVVPDAHYYVCAGCQQETPWSWVTDVNEDASAAICRACASDYSSRPRGYDYHVCRQCGGVGPIYAPNARATRYGVCADCRDRRQAAERERRAEQRAKLAASKGKTCDHCGATFDATRPDARYCSTTCRVAAHRKRRRTSSN